MNTQYAGSYASELVQAELVSSYRELKKMLASEQFITEKGSLKTNITDVAARRTYYVPPEHQERFFILLERARRENCALHFNERQENADTAQTGIMLDFDCLQSSKDRIINDKHYEYLVRRLCKVINDTLDIAGAGAAATTQVTYHVFIIAKPAVVLHEAGASTGAAANKQQPVYKDGFHILVPELQVLKAYKKYLCEQVQQFLPQVFGSGTAGAWSLPSDPDYTPERMLDRMSASVPVHFFGNCKVGSRAYALAHAYEITYYPEDGDCDRRRLPAEEFDPVRGAVSINGMLVGVNLAYELSLGFYMRVLDGAPTWLHKRACAYKVHLETPIALLVEKAAVDPEDVEDVNASVDILALNNAEVAYLRRLLGILPIEYATDYDKWFGVICALANTNAGYQDLAVWFSQRAPTKYSAAAVLDKWNEAVVSARAVAAPLTIRSIQHWARLGAPTAYEEINDDYYKNHFWLAALENKGEITEAKAAHGMWLMLREKFACDINEAEIKETYKFYEFVTAGQSMKPGQIYKWRCESDHPDNMFLFISNVLPRVYTALITTAKDLRAAATEERLLAYYDIVVKNLEKSRKHLGKDAFQRAVVTQARYRFRARGFCDELDADPLVFGCGNGVLRLGARVQFITGFHEHKISKYTDTHYKLYDPACPFTRELEEGFHNIFPEEDVYRFMMMHMANGLSGEEPAFILLMLTGGGRNGKSFTGKMVHNTLGKTYCATGKPTLVTSRMEHAGSANSAQMQQKGKRWFYIEEFDKCEALNIARIKALVSPSWQSGRDLNLRQENFTLSSDTVLMTNYDFVVDTTDDGTWRRLYYYRNKVKFCPNPDPANPYEKRENPDFIYKYAKHPMYKQAMLSIMCHWYEVLARDYGGNLYNVPVPTIARETEEYRNTQDKIHHFIRQMVVQCSVAGGVDRANRADAGLTAAFELLDECTPAGALTVPSDAAPVGVTIDDLARAYSDWYRANINTAAVRMSLMEVKTQFENSCLGDKLVAYLGTKYLPNCRIRANTGEPLMPGETLYKPPVAKSLLRISALASGAVSNGAVASAVQQKPAVDAVYTTSLDQAAGAPAQKNQDDFLPELPTVLQRRDARTRDAPIDTPNDNAEGGDLLADLLGV